jgi:predicted nucleic acid-binding protein
MTFDTGALIALEARRQRISEVFRFAQKHRHEIFVPIVVLAEWWVGRTDVRENILAAVTKERLTIPIAQLAGRARAEVRRPDGRVPSVVDAIVMASAELRRDVVYTSDPRDLVLLRDGFFKSVRVVLA